MNYYALIIAVIFLITFVVMFFKCRKYLALLVIGVVLFLPKINIISLSASSAGLRTDDLLIAFFVLFTLIGEKCKSYKAVFRTVFFKIFLFYIISSIVSFIFGICTGYTYSLSLSFFGLVRKVEYFCFAFVGYDLYFFHQENTKTILKKLCNVFIVFTAIISFFQVVGLLGSFRYGAYDASSFLYRAVGTFNGPYELGAFCAITAIIYYYDFLKNQGKKWVNMLFLVLSLTLVLFSQSRSPLLIVVAILIVMTLFYGKLKLKIAVLSLSVAAMVIFLILLNFTHLSVLERFRSLDLGELWNSTVYYFNHRSYDEYLRTMNDGTILELYVIQTGDISFNIRIFKWMALIEIFIKFPLFGYGFGSNSVIDGNYVKMLAENGIIGLILFLWVFYEIIKNNRQQKNQGYLTWVIISVLLGGVLIDMFEASKVMEPLWFLIGAAGVGLHNNQKISPTIIKKESHKILQIVSALDAGGVETLLYTYYSHMDRNLLKFDIAITNDRRANGLYYDRFKALGCEIFVLPRKKHFMKYHFKLKKILQNGQYSAIHVHQDEMSFQSLLCAKQCHITVRIAHAHHNYKIANLKFRICRALTNQLCTHRFACSKDAGVSLFGKKNFFIMKNAIDVNKFLFNDTIRTKLRKQYHLENKVVVGTVARLAEQKNPQYAIDVMAEVMKQMHNVVYVWVGNGELYFQIEKLIQEKGLQDKILLLGEQFNVSDFYHMFDVFFLPSREEGLGISAVEAQYNGLPCILSTAFPQEVVLFSDKVSMIDCNCDINLCAKTISDCINSCTNQRLITNQQVLDCYSIDKYSNTLENIYKEIML